MTPTGGNPTIRRGPQRRGKRLALKFQVQEPDKPGLVGREEEQGGETLTPSKTTAGGCSLGVVLSE